MFERFLRLLSREPLSSSAVSRPTQSSHFDLEMLEDRTTPAMFNPTTVAELIADINTANLNADVDTIDLGGATFTLTVIDNNSDGDNGLPSILADSGNALTIQNGTIERDSMAAADFRLLRVAVGVDLTLSRVTLQGGLMADASGDNSYGGAILNFGAVTISESLVTNNQAYRFGGAILNAVGASLTIESSTLSGNTAGGGAPSIQGGAIRNSGVLSIRNSTLSGNTSLGTGGAIANYTNATLELVNSTIANNTALAGGGVTNIFNATITNLESTIIAGNTAGDDPDLSDSGTITTASNNLIESADGHSIMNGVNGNIVGSPANLGPLQDNGGPTPTHALLTGSLAINAGSNPLALASDQRGTGFAREIGGQTDIGAFELQEADISITKTAPVTEIVRGGVLTYTIVVTNNGPDTDTMVSVTDTFPMQLENVSYTSVAAGGATGNTAAGMGNLAETLDMPSGSSVTYTVMGTVAATAMGTISNTATAAGSFDPDTSNNSATEDVDVLLADIAITKNASANVVAPGESLIYTIIVSNNGPSGDPLVNVADLFPAELINVTYTSVALGGATGNTTNGAGNIADTLNLPTGSSVIYTVTGIIADDVPPGTILNTATVAGSFDPNTDNNASSVEVLVDSSVFAPGTNERFVENLYRDLLGRDPDPAGFAGWVNLLNEGMARSEVVDGFQDSAEHLTRRVTVLYLQLLHREPDADGLAGWVNFLLDGNSIGTLTSSILASAEYASLHPTPNDFVTALYVDLLGRLPSSEELSSWTSSGLSNQEIVDSFLDSPERITKTIERFYIQFLNRQADPSGLTGFANDVLDGDLTLNEVVGSILSSDEYYNLVRPAV